METVVDILAVITRGRLDEAGDMIGATLASE